MLQAFATTVGGSALDSIVGIVVGKISSLVDQKLSSVKDDHGVGEIKKWPQMLEAIWGVIESAESQQLAKRGVTSWLEDVEDLALDMEDKLDELNSGSIVNAEMVSEMEILTARLNDMMERKIQLDLVERNISAPNRSSLSRKRPQSGPVLSAPVIYGREKEKRSLLDFLVRFEEGVAVMPIVGMGGLGKTTLAQYAYNRREVVNTFRVRAWVCVSKDYDMAKILRGILEAITSSPCNLHDLSLIQRQVYEALQGKLFLIVLDDLWNDSYGDWEALRAPLMMGAAGSKVIVTTRSEKVADVVRTVERYEALTCLSEGDCWSLFRSHAGLDFESDSRLVDIGMKIARKCSGLPLAARTMGGLVRWKENEDDWEAILNSSSWRSKEGIVEIMSVLRVSYNALPSHLQRCFAFCALFPEDFKFKEDDVVMLWIGAGLIQSLQSKHLESKSRDCFRELVSRSMFLQSSDDSSYFSMHDLVGELAKEVSRNKSCRFEDEDKCLQTARHLSFNSSRFSDVVTELGFLQRKALPWRTLLPLGGSSLSSSSPYTIDRMFSKLRVLRVLSLPHYSHTELSESIGELKLLRYLDLSSSSIRKLPDSVTSLQNLEILILAGCCFLNELPLRIGKLFNLRRLDMRDCYGLRELPLQFGNLVNLYHMDCSNCHNLRELPKGIGNLTNLHLLDLSYCSGLAALPSELGVLTNLSVFDITGSYEIVKLPLEMKDLRQLRKMSDFIVGGNNGLPLNFLGGFKRLHGALRISMLENVAYSEDAKAARLSEKLLDDLTLEWTPQAMSNSCQASVLDHLQPHKNLKKLCIAGFTGSWFPQWLAASSMERLMVLKLINCESSKSLPFTRTLPSLKELIVEECPALEITLPALPSLKKLSICGAKGLDCQAEFCIESLQEFELSNITTFTSMFQDRVKRALHHAKALSIGCSNVATILPRWTLPNFSVIGAEIVTEQLKVECLDVKNQATINHLPPWVSQASFLRSLNIWDCQSLATLLPTADFPDTLSSIEIRNCDQITSISNQGKLPLQLKTLVISNCPNLENVVERIANSLESFQVNSGCPLLVRKLPHFLNFLPSLTTLKISDCNEEILKLLGLCMMPNLKCIHLVNCPDVESFPPENLVLPDTLTSLTLDDSPDLKRLSSFRQVGSLADLSIWSCPSLEMVSQSGLPHSLQTIDIRDCHLLENKVRDSDVSLCQKISHIRLLKLDNSRVFFNFVVKDCL